MVLFISAAVSSIDRYASIGGLSNQSSSMATQVGSAVDDRRLESLMSVERDIAVKHGSSISTGMLCQWQFSGFRPFYLVHHCFIYIIKRAQFDFLSVSRAQYTGHNQAKPTTIH